MTVRMSEEQPHDLATEQVSLWNAHDVDGVLAHLTDDVLWSTPAKTVSGMRAAAGLDLHPDLCVRYFRFPFKCAASLSILSMSNRSVGCRGITLDDCWTTGSGLSVPGPCGRPPTGRSGCRHALARTAVGGPYLPAPPERNRVSSGSRPLLGSLLLVAALVAIGVGGPVAADPSQDPTGRSTRATVAATTPSAAARSAVTVTAKGTKGRVHPPRNLKQERKVVPPRKVTRPARCTKAAPTTAAGWKNLFDSLGGRFAAGDQLTSTPLPDGRLLWVLGDTIQGKLTSTGAVKNWRMARNTVAITDRGCISLHTGKGGRSLIPEPGRGHWYWPMAPTLDGGKLYTFSGRFKAAAGSFAGVGSELAELRYERGSTPTFSRMHRTPSTGTPETKVQWGMATARDGAYTYVYGTQKVVAPWTFGKALYVARVPAGKLTTLGAWRYWNGRTWATSGAKPIRDAMGGVSTSLTVDKIGGRWVAVTKKEEMLGTDIVALTADHPAGPFKETVLAKAPGNVAKGDITYSVMAHPEVRLSSGKLLISVCRNNLDGDRVLRNFERGRPYFLEVTLPR